MTKTQALRAVELIGGYRKTGETVRGNLTLGLAYDIACSGELSK